MIVSAIYCVITIFSFQNVLDVYWNDDNNVKSHRLWAFLAATILSPAMVIGFFAFGTITLLCKTLGEGGLTYSYGALHVSSLWMAVLVLQSSVTIHAYKEQMKEWEVAGNSDSDAVEDWSGNDTALAQVAYGIGYVLAIVYFSLFFVLFIFRAAAQRLIIAPQAAKAKAKKEEGSASAVEAKAPDAPEPEETVPIKKTSSDVKDAVHEKAKDTSSSGFSWWRGKS